MDTIVLRRMLTAGRLNHELSDLWNHYVVHARGWHNDPVRGLDEFTEDTKERAIAAWNRDVESLTRRKNQ